MALSLRGRAGAAAGSRAAPGSVEVRMEVTQDDLRDLVRAINAHGDAKAIRRELSKGMREAVKPLVPKARTAVLTEGTSGGKSTGLRKDMARAVQVKLDMGVRSKRIGVRIRLDGSKLRGRPSSLVAYYEGALPWRHPTFGHDPWVSQPHRGFLTDVVDANRESVTRRIIDAMDDIGRKIDKGV